MNLDWGPGSDKETMLFVFPSPVIMVKSHEKKSQNYFRVTTNDMVKCRCGQQAKMMKFDYCGEYLKGVISNKIFIMAVLRKTHSHSVLICILIRKSLT